MKKRKCPFCKKEHNKGPGNHIYVCAKKHGFNLSKDEIKYEHLKFNFPKISQNNFYNDYTINLLGLPAIQTKYGLDYKSIQWLLNYYNIEKRTVSESCLIGAERTRKSLFKKFGVTNVSQLETIKRKKEKTCLEKYGVDNYRKSKEFRINFDKHIQSKYNLTVAELRGKRGKEYWNKLTDEQRYAWLKKSIWSNRGNKSRLETIVQEKLNELNLTYTRQFCISKKYYDFLINDYNIIIEVNGTYWHADPIKYKKTDFINYPYGTILAEEIWKRDYQKRKIAEEKGYKLIYIWENEIKVSKNILNLISEKLKIDENN